MSAQIVAFASSEPFSRGTTLSSLAYQDGRSVSQLAVNSRVLVEALSCDPIEIGGIDRVGDSHA